MEVLSRVLAFAFACHPHITIQSNFWNKIDLCQEAWQIVKFVRHQLSRTVNTEPADR